VEIVRNMTEDEQHQARINLIAALVMEYRPCDENGELDEQEAVKQGLVWNQLTDEQLQEAALYIVMGKSPLRNIPPYKKRMDYPLRARPTLEVL
jgi:hypothetical protein